MPSAVAGQGGHGAAFAVAVALVHGFGLSDIEAWPILLEYNVRCLPPWSEAELRHKLKSAGRLTRHPKPRGYLCNDTHEEQPRYFSPPHKPERTHWTITPEPLPSKPDAVRVGSRHLFKQAPASDTVCLRLQLINVFNPQPWSGFRQLFVYECDAMLTSFMVRAAVSERCRRSGQSILDKARHFSASTTRERSGYLG